MRIVTIHDDKNVVGFADCDGVIEQRAQPDAQALIMGTIQQHQRYARLPLRHDARGRGRASVVIDHDRDRQSRRLSQAFHALKQTRQRDLLVKSRQPEIDAADGRHCDELRSGGGD